MDKMDIHADAPRRDRRDAGLPSDRRVAARERQLERGEARRLKAATVGWDAVRFQPMRPSRPGSQAWSPGRVPGSWPAALAGLHPTGCDQLA